MLLVFLILILILAFCKLYLLNKIFGKKGSIFKVIFKESLDDLLIRFKKHLVDYPIPKTLSAMWQISVSLLKISIIFLPMLFISNIGKDDELLIIINFIQFCFQILIVVITSVFTEAILYHLFSLFIKGVNSLCLRFKEKGWSTLFTKTLFIYLVIFTFFIYAFSTVSIFFMLFVGYEKTGFAIFYVIKFFCYLITDGEYHKYLKMKNFSNSLVISVWESSIINFSDLVVGFGIIFYQNHSFLPGSVIFFLWIATSLYTYLISGLFQIDKFK